MRYKASVVLSGFLLAALLTAGCGGKTDCTTAKDFIKSYSQAYRDGNVQAGRHEQTWDGRGEDGRRLGAGVYFLRVEAAKGRAAEKLVVLR